MKLSKARAASGASELALTPPENTVMDWMESGSSPSTRDALEIHQFAELLESQRHLAVGHQ